MYGHFLYSQMSHEKACSATARRQREPQQPQRDLPLNAPRSMLKRSNLSADSSRAPQPLRVQPSITRDCYDAEGEYKHQKQTLNREASTYGY
uniref:Uncharacterized protein n=1 Tax=Knipowitschia caucasica TaxID=637954 RepID=A0AAV2KZM6_KNICA